MPGEFEPHARCWMAWPCRRSAFGTRLEAARAAYASVARTISGFEPITMLANSIDVSEAARLCGPGVTILPMDIDDSWTRDTGPTFLVDDDRCVAGVDWIFNGWGNIYPDHEQDAQMARKILDHLGMRRYEADLVSEGGAVHVDGRGTFLAVEPAILDDRRNPGMSRKEAENILSACLGVQQFIWLPFGLENDETAGHVDNVACFVRPGVVLVNSTSDPQDGNYLGSRENKAVLRASRDTSGRTLEVIPIEQPGYREGKEGRMALSYINFYIANGGIVMPAFDDPLDQAAFQAIRRIYPDRKVVQLPVLDILYGGGGIHCITQQQPEGDPLPPQRRADGMVLGKKTLS